MSRFTTGASHVSHGFGYWVIPSGANGESGMNLLHPASPDRWDDRDLKALRLPNLSSLLTNSKTQWQSFTVNGWYGGGQRGTSVGKRFAKQLG